MSAPKQPGVVVATDGSAASNVAVTWAARDAAMRNVPLTIVHAVVTPTASWPPMPYPDSLAVRLEDDGKKAIMHAVKIAEDAMPADRKVPIGRELVFATPAAILITMSAQADLVVVGSSGRGLLTRGVIGSVSSTVVRQASCPVAVIHDGELPRPDAPVLVGIDGSPASELATEIAFDEASRRGVSLVALHAWSDLDVSEWPGIDWPATQSMAEEVLAERLAGWQERYPDVHVRRVVVEAQPARRLVREADRAQLVVVGSRGRGGFAGMLVGSVGETVAQLAKVPVIVAR